MNNQEANPTQVLELQSLADDCLNYLRYLADLGAPELPEELGGPGPALPVSAAAGRVQPAQTAGMDQKGPAVSELPDVAGQERCRTCPQGDILKNLRQGPAKLMIIVERFPEASPRSAEEEQLLVNIIEKGYQLSLDQVCLAPAQKCRQSPGTSSFCLTSWQAYCEKAHPKVIMIMGAQAGEAALSSQARQKPWRKGTWANWRDIPALFTHSPAQLLENPGLKRETWTDIKKVLAYLASLDSANESSGS